MRFLNALSIGGVGREPEWIVVPLDAVLMATPVVAAKQEAEHLTRQEQP